MRCQSSIYLENQDFVLENLFKNPVWTLSESFFSSVVLYF